MIVKVLFAEKIGNKNGKIAKSGDYESISGNNVKFWRPSSLQFSQCSPRSTHVCVNQLDRRELRGPKRVIALVEKTRPFFTGHKINDNIEF